MRRIAGSRIVDGCEADQIPGNVCSRVDERVGFGDRDACLGLFGSYGLLRGLDPLGMGSPSLHAAAPCFIPLPILFVLSTGPSICFSAVPLATAWGLARI